MQRKIRNPKERKRSKRAVSIRKKLEGSAERPRLAVFRSSKHIYAQLIDDVRGVTMTTASTQSPDIREELKTLKKMERSVRVGKKIAELAKAMGVEAVIFDRAGYPYHGRIAALANGAREAGLKF